MIRYTCLIIKSVFQDIEPSFPDKVSTPELPMDTKQDRVLRDRFERLRDENRGLRAELAALRKEKRGIERGLKETKELFDLVPGPLLLIQQGVIILANEAVREQLGYREEELLGQGLQDLIHPNSIGYVENLRRQRVSEKSLKDQYEIYLLTKEGETLCYDLQVKRIRYQGRKAFLLNMFRADQRKQEEMRLRQSLRLDSLIRMASGLNKEFRSCLSVLGDYTKHFQDTSPIKTEPEAWSARRLEAAWERGSFISRQLSCLTRTENEPSELSLLDMRQMVRDAIRLTRPKWKKGAEAPEGEIKVKTYLRPLSPVKGNPQEVRDVLTIMILNAVDALPNGGQIYLSTEENSGFAHVYIQDNGIGIKEDIKERIFDPFFTTKDGSVQGMGLSLAHAIVTRHGGEIEVLSRDGHGATFILKLPLARVSPPCRAKGARAGIKNSGIMIISGGGIVQEVLSKSFLGKGAKVTVASTATQCLRILKKSKFDLVIADLNIPHLDPSKIIPLIKQLDHNLPIVLVNSRKERKIRRGLKGLGADLVVGMPLEMDKILSFFSQALAGKGRS